METAEDLALMDREPDNRVVIDGCNTVSGLFWKRVTELADKVVIREKDFGIWNEFTWGDFGKQARLAGLGLKSLGLQRGDICSVASEINKEWMFADLGIIGVGRRPFTVALLEGQHVRRRGRGDKHENEEGSQ